MVKQANNDADVLIIETAIEQFNLTNTTIVVGEDVDLLVLLTARTPTEKTIFFLKPGKAQRQSDIYSSKSLFTFVKCQNHVLFLHAITGCDTTSAFYRRGKTAVFKMFEKQDLIQCAEVFKKSNSTQQEVITNGIRFLLSMYGAPKKTTCLDKHRYACFVKNTKNEKQVQIACLPPTSIAAHQHLFRVYYQVQVWLGYQLDPTDWGWKLVNNILEPVQTLLPPAPEKLLNTIFCNCKKGCSAKCGCKKVGLFCSLACTNCQGRSCSNIESQTMEDSFDSDEVSCDTSLLTQLTCIQNEDEEEAGEEEQEEDQEEEQEFETYESDE